MAKRKTETKKVLPSPSRNHGLEIVPSVPARGGDIDEIPFQEALRQLRQAVDFVAEQTFKLNLSIGHNPALGTKGNNQFYLDWAHTNIINAKSRLEAICEEK